MSYSVQIPASDKGGLAKALGSAKMHDEHDGAHAAGEGDAQLEAIYAAVEDLAKVVGRPEDQVIVEIAGHANPDHAPAWLLSNEVLHLTIRAVPAEPASAPVAEGPVEEPTEAPAED